MNFLAPWMLFGAAAVGVPIALHFFFRSRYRTVPWAAMKFLLTSIEQTSRRLRFQELLLLALRCLLLAALAFAMARPITSAARGSGRGDAVDAVFVIDNSYSMGASDGAVSRFERAKAAAIDTIDHLPPYSTVQVVTCDDQALLVGPRSPSNLDQARQLILDLELTSRASDLAPGLTEAKAVLERGQLPNKELYLFGDLQKSGWERQATNLINEFKEIKEKASVTLVRCGNRPLRNVTIAGITPQAGVPRPGERIGFAVLVRNTGNDEVSEIKVNLTADDDDKSSETVTIPSLAGGETRAVTLAAKFDKAGPRVLTARIVQDDVPGDNRLDEVIPVRDQVNVLIVNGRHNDREPDKSATYFLNHALLPIKDLDRAKYYLQLREVEPRLASPALLNKTDLVFLVNVGVPLDDKRFVGDGAIRKVNVPADFLSELAAWVRQGRGLVIIPGENSQADAYNKVLGDRLGLLPLPLKEVHEFDVKNALRLNRATFNLPAFWKFKEDRYFAGFNEVQVLKAFELAEPAAKETKEDGASKDKEPGAEVVLRHGNGWPAVAVRRVDAGEVFFVTSAAEPAWSDWPIRPEYLPFIQTLLAHLLHEQTQSHNVTAGQTLTWFPRDKELRNFALQTPSGRQIRLGLPEVKDKRQVLTLSDLHQAGVYRLLARTATQDETAKDVGVPIAVAPDFRESQDLSSLTDEQIDARLGFTPVHVVAGAERSQAAGLDRFHREWTLWILMIVLGLVLAESGLAWLCGKAW